MIDHYVVPYQQQLLLPPSRLLGRWGISADHVTMAGFAVGTSALPALATGHYWIALAVILCNRILDGMDGVVARLKGSTSRGAFLDICFDFLFYALVPLGFAIADPEANAVAAAVLIFSFVGTGSSFLAFSVVAAQTGLESIRFPKKGIYYLGGLTEGAETISLFIAMCVWPAMFPMLAYVFAFACLVTTLMRWKEGWLAFDT